MSAHTAETDGPVPESFQKLLNEIGKAPNRLQILDALTAYERETSIRRMSKIAGDLVGDPLPSVLQHHRRRWN